MVHDWCGPMPELILGDARALPLPDESVDLVACSPPYLGLRDYGADGQIGTEASPQEFLDALIACTREMVRVLKPSGSIFVNLGDSYATRYSSRRVAGRAGLNGDDDTRGRSGQNRTGVPEKSLHLVPHRYAIRCVDELGLICRQDQVWAKANPIPDSAADRTGRIHEYLFHLVKSPRYYSACDEIREATQGRADQMTWEQRKARGDALRQGEQRGTFGGGGMAQNPLGKIPGSVWTVATQPLKVPAHLGVQHFAAWPMEIPRRLIQGWSPREVCTVCGEGRRPNRGRACEACGEFIPTQGKNCAACGHVRDWKAGRVARAEMGATDWSTAGHGTPRHPGGHVNSTIVEGDACACPDTSAPSTPGVVLDPFSGTGTTALVATMLGRRGIGVDLNPDYCRLAEWRANDPKERARAAGLDPDAVSSIARELPGQLTFDAAG